MSAYKKFNSQDVYVSTYTAKKNWVVSGSQYSDYGVVNIPGYSGSGVYTVSAKNLHKNYDRRLVYESVNHLYYSAFENGTIQTSSSFDNFLQSSFNISGSRDLSEVISVYSLPKGIYGTAIQPNSLEITPETGSAFTEYHAFSASVDSTVIYANSNLGYSDTPNTIEIKGRYYGSVPNWKAGSTRRRISRGPVTDGHSETIIDDGEGNLFYKKNSGYELHPTKVGNVIYTHGQIILANDVIARYFNNYVDAEIKWKSTHPIYTYNFHCKLKENEFTHTFNPSALSGSNGDIADNVAGKEFSPYITTIGLYNDANELIAVAKTGQPIPIPKDSDMTIVAKIDL